MTLDAKAALEAFTSAVDEIDRLVDMVAPFVPTAAAWAPLLDKLTAVIDKAKAVAVNSAPPLAAEVAAFDAAAVLAEDKKFPPGAPPEGS